MSVTFRYRAVRADGSRVTGVVESPTSIDAARRLGERDLFVLALDPAPSAAPSLRPSASRRDLALVFRSLAALVAAGIPVAQAVTATEPLAHGPLREALVEVRRELGEGRTLAQALVHTAVFPPLVTGMIRAGERGSQLGTALGEVATHLELEAEMVAKVRQALAYPVLLLIAGAISVLVITTVVVPRFAVILADLGQQLPPTTRALLASSTFLRTDGWLLLLICAVLLGWMGHRLGDGERRRRLFDLLLRIPVLGPLRHALGSARLCRALGGMLGAGMPLLTALHSARDALGDPALAHRLDRAADRVAQGAPLTAALEREGALVASALQLVAVGESSGQLAVMVRRAGDLASQEADRALRTLTGLLEPGLIVVFGGLVAFVAAALLQAVYAVRPGM
ncbi:MAG TPA: type II secretion system F family protein [Gemmatimonadales bacterium]|nr:type II secretion system F family protein [Gemmatimonadales bacterium]